MAQMKDVTVKVNVDTTELHELYRILEANKNLVKELRADRHVSVAEDGPLKDACDALKVLAWYMEYNMDHTDVVDAMLEPAYDVLMRHGRLDSWQPLPSRFAHLAYKYGSPHN